MLVRSKHLGLSIGFGLAALLAIASPFLLLQSTEQTQPSAQAPNAPDASAEHLKPLQKIGPNGELLLGDKTKSDKNPAANSQGNTTTANTPDSKPATSASSSTSDSTSTATPAPATTPTTTPATASKPVATTKPEATTPATPAKSDSLPPVSHEHELIVFFGVSPTDANAIIRNAQKNSNANLDAFSGATRLTQKQSLLSKKQLQNVGGDPYEKNITTIPSLSYIAALLREETKAPIYNIVTTTHYPRQTAKLFEYVRKEKNDNIIPELTDDGVIDLDNADRIYLCYPIWLNELPQAVRSFLLKYDLSGKTIVPVIVHSNPFNDRTLRTLTSAEPNATIYTPALTIQTGLFSDLKKLHQVVQEYLEDNESALEQLPR